MRRALAVEPRTLRTERLTLRPKRAPEQVPPRPVVPQWGVNPTWAIESHGEEVGRIHLLVRADDQIAEIGYSIVQKHWNQGLATESVRAVIDWAFETLNLVKVYARTEVWNVGSWRVLENVGMTQEARLRSHRTHRGGRTDETWYGVLREEWEGPGQRGGPPPTV